MSESGIYIRYNGQIIIANYYNDIYGNRMISRATNTIESSVIYNGNNSYFCLMTSGEFTVSVSKKYASLYKEALKRCDFSFLRVTDERNIRNDIKIDVYSDVIQEYYEEGNDITISGVYKDKKLNN